MIEFVLNFIQSKVHKFYNYHQKKKKDDVNYTKLSTFLGLLHIK